jgi:Secretion system C-terminal sorting domain
MKNILAAFLILIISNNITAQITVIPDANFEEWLIDHNIDSDGTINGQILTSDAEGVTELSIGWDGYAIEDLTGLQDFTDLESFAINAAPVAQLDLTHNSKLKILECTNMYFLTELDLSSNPLLEYLDVNGIGDIGGSGPLQVLDLSANPNIHTIIASNSFELERINLRNGNNSTAMHIEIGVIQVDGPPLDPDQMLIHVCIEVDDEATAQNNQSPYSEWEIEHPHTTYQLVEDCELGLKDIKDQSLRLYPNPANDIVTIANTTPIEEITIYDSTGRMVLHQKCNDDTVPVNISSLQAGSYIIKVTTASGAATGKLVAI